MSWSDGYHTEAEYTSGYYKELSPTMQRFAALLNGYDLPAAREDDVHIELGFGQGVSINIHAATHLGQFIGNDFNPNHAAHAQKLARAAGTNAQLSDESFAQMDARHDLPMCNSVSFHGIWSWINDENREHMLNIIKRCLKPGGVVYNSYNVFSGHAAFIPWRDMMWHYFEEQKGPAIGRIEATIAHFSEVFQQNPQLLEQNAVLKNTWERIQNADRHYLLHEYFNANWDCFSLQQVSDMMVEAKLQFIGSTNANQYLNQVALNPQSLAQVMAQSNVTQAESWRDALTGNTFRRDLYVKGGQRLEQWQMVQRLLEYRFVMTVPVSKFANYLYNPKDSRQFNQDLFDPIVKVLSADAYQPKKFAQLLDALDQKKYNWLNALQVVLLKIESGQLQICLEEDVLASTKQATEALNRALLQELDTKVGSMYVACTTTGMGLTLDFNQAWMLRVLSDNAKAKDAEIAQHIWQCLQNNSRLLINNNGQKLEGEKAHVNFLLDVLKEVREFVPVWTQLGIL